MQNLTTTSEVIELEFWFEFASNYSYLSVMRIEALARRYPVRIKWCPFLLGPIFKSLGWTTSPFVLQKNKGDYVWQDMQRQAKKYGLDWTQPTQFPRPSVLPMRVAAAYKDAAWMPAFCQAMMRLNFVEDHEIDNAMVVHQVLVDLGLDASFILRELECEENKAKLRQQTEVAISKKIFGAPSFIVEGQLFWGDDRLQDALQLAQELFDARQANVDKVYPYD